MRKLPIIGLVIGAVAAGIAVLKRKKDVEKTDETAPDDMAPSA